MRWYRSVDAVDEGQLRLVVEGRPLHALWLISDEHAFSEFWIDSMLEGFGEGDWSCWRGDINKAKSPRIREHKRALGDLSPVVSLGPGQYTVDLGPSSPIAYFDVGAFDEPNSRQFVSLLAAPTACYSVGLVFTPTGRVDLGADLAIMLAGWLLSRDPSTGRERAALLSTFLDRTIPRGVVVLLLTTDENTKPGLVAFGDEAVLDHVTERFVEVGGRLTGGEFRSLVNRGLHLPFCT
jgi:hypothetical protein